MSKAPLLVALSVLAAVTAGCEQRSITTLAGPTPIPTTPTTAPAPSFLGNWTSLTLMPAARSVAALTPAATSFNPKSCGNFQWNVTSQDATSISGSFSLVCQDDIVLTATGTGVITSATTITLNFSGSGNLPTGLCTFSISSNGTLVDPDTLSLPYSATTCLGPLSGSTTLRRTHPTPPAEPALPPPPTPTPEPPSPAPPSPPPATCVSSLPSEIVECERDKYAGSMSHGQMLDFVIATARSLNANGIGGGPFGILRKTGGTNCGGYSCDIVCTGAGDNQRQWDVLADIDNAQIPAWIGPKVVPNIRIDICLFQ